MYKEIIDFKKVLENYDKKKTCFVFDVDETLINTSREDFGKSNLTKEQINKITKIIKSDSTTLPRSVPKKP